MTNHNPECTLETGAPADPTKPCCTPGLVRPKPTLYEVRWCEVVLLSAEVEASTPEEAEALALESDSQTELDSWIHESPEAEPLNK